MICPIKTIKDIEDLFKKLAQENGIPEQFENTWQHNQVVWKFAKWIADRAIEQGILIDLKFLEKGCYIHDLGRAVTGSLASKELKAPIYHGIIGAEILREFRCEKLARICENHIGSGITKDEAVVLGLPSQDYLPISYEEKIICYADARVFFDEKCKHDTIKPFKDAYERFSVYGNSGGRLKSLEKDLENIINQKIPDSLSE